MNDKPPMVKMYILIKKSLPSHKVAAAARASVACVERFRDRPETQEWLKNSFKCMICEVTDKEFEAAKCEENYVLIKSPEWKDLECALAFKPRIDWPSEFKYYPLMRV